jgi:hypothetical protein
VPGDTEALAQHGDHGLLGEGERGRVHRILTTTASCYLAGVAA